MPALSKVPPSVESHRQRNSTHIFCNLSSTALAEYQMIGPTVMLRRSELLFREGDLGDRVFVLCGGHVKLSCLSREGRKMNQKIASPGDILGLSAVISGVRFEASAEAMETTFAQVICRKDFLTILANQAEAGMYIAKLLYEEYKSALSQARLFALSKSASGRIASLLLAWGLSEAAGKSEMRFTMPLTHNDLADFTATTRETVTRVLGRFQKDKLIMIRGHSVRILMPDRLAALTT